MSQQTDQHQQPRPYDGLRVVHDNDTVRVLEPNDRASVTIWTHGKNDNNPFRVELFRSTQEIKDANGKCVARTLDPEMAKRICHLLIAHSIWESKKAGG